MNKPHEEIKQRDENVSQKTAGLLRIPDIHALVDEGINRRKEFNTTKEIWPSIDAKEDENGAMPRGVKSYSSILRATPQLNMPSLPVENKVYSKHSQNFCYANKPERNAIDMIYTYIA